jgi:hypothetical protein
MRTHAAPPRAERASTPTSSPAAPVARALRALLGGSLVLATVLAPSTGRAANGPLVRPLEDVLGAETRPGPVAAWAPLTTGTSVPSLSEMRSGDLPVRLGLRNGTTLTLTPHTRVAINGALDIDLGPKDGKSSATSLELRAGEVVIEVPQSAAPRSVLLAKDETYIVTMPGASARVRLVGNPDDPSARLAVAADSGDVRVATTGAWVKMPAHSALDLKPKTKVPAPSPLPTSPAWKLDADSARIGPLAVVTGEGKATLAFRWASVRGAVGYVAEVARDPEFRDIVTKGELGEKDGAYTTPPLPAGRYHARVRGTGLAGFPGPMSAPRELRVVSVALPPGAVEREGKWAMPLVRPAKLGDAAGLEISIGKGGFFNAPAEFSLKKEEPTLLQLRLKGEKAIVPVQVVPRELVAAVELTPKRAVWPSDPIHITVRVRESGRDAAEIEPQMRVTLGMDEVAVMWDRDGAVWRGTLAPMRLRGPEVVRVAVSDPWGNEIGRSFLEVDSSDAPVASR